MSIGLQCNSNAFFISYQFEMFFWIDLKYGIRTIVPVVNWGPPPPPPPLVRVRVWFRVSLRTKVRGTIFLLGNCPRTLNYITIIF